MESLNESTADTILARQKLRSIWVAWKMHIYEQKKLKKLLQILNYRLCTQALKKYVDIWKERSDLLMVVYNKQKKAHLLHQYYSKLTFFKKLRTHYKNQFQLLQITASASILGNKIKLRKYWSALKKNVSDSTKERDNNAKTIAFWMFNSKYKATRSFQIHTANQKYKRERLTNAHYLYENELMKKIMHAILEIRHRENQLQSRQAEAQQQIQALRIRNTIAALKNEQLESLSKQHKREAACNYYRTKSITNTFTIIRNITNMPQKHYKEVVSKATAKRFYAMLVKWTAMSKNQNQSNEKEIIKNKCRKCLTSWQQAIINKKKQKEKRETLVQQACYAKSINQLKRAFNAWNMVILNKHKLINLAAVFIRTKERQFISTCLQQSKIKKTIGLLVELYGRAQVTIRNNTQKQAFNNWKNITDERIQAINTIESNHRLTTLGKYYRLINNLYQNAQVQRGSKLSEAKFALALYKKRRLLIEWKRIIPALKENKNIKEEAYEEVNNAMQNNKKRKILYALDQYAYRRMKKAQNQQTADTYLYNKRANSSINKLQQYALKRKLCKAKYSQIHDSKISSTKAHCLYALKKIVEQKHHMEKISEHAIAQWANYRYKQFFNFWKIYIAKSKRSKQDEKDALLLRKRELRMMALRKWCAVGFYWVSKKIMAQNNTISVWMKWLLRWRNRYLATKHSTAIERKMQYKPPKSRPPLKAKAPTKIEEKEKQLMGWLTNAMPKISKQSSLAYIEKEIKEYTAKKERYQQISKAGDTSFSNEISQLRIYLETEKPKIKELVGQLTSIKKELNI